MKRHVAIFFAFFKKFFKKILKMVPKQKKPFVLCSEERKRRRLVWDVMRKQRTHCQFPDGK